MAEKILTKQDLINDLEKIGVKKGDLLHLKVSMRSIGKIEGGADTLVEALLDVVGEEGTIVSDAFIDVFPLPLSKENRKKIADDKTPSYAGAFANAMIRHPKSVRSKHPIQKFSAIGKLAKELCYNHTDKSGGYDLLRDMINLNAKNLTIGGKVIGVGTTHVAIEDVGLERKKPNAGRLYYDENGNIKLAKVDWNGGCARGFPKFIPLYRDYGAIINEGYIGNAYSLLTDMKKTYEVEVNKLKQDPKFFFCDDPACYSCRIAWKHSDKKYLKFLYHWTKKHAKDIINPKKLIYYFKYLKS